MAHLRQSDRLWASASSHYRAILSHPFLLGVADGTLPSARFSHFLRQDRLFLEFYSRCLCVLAAKAPTAAAVLYLTRDAVASLESEEAAEARWLRQVRGTDDETPPKPCPTTLAYGSYLLSTVYSGSFLLGAAAVLPCYWVYSEVGLELARRGSPSPIYQSWIDSYADPGFGTVARRFRDMFDEAAGDQSPADLMPAQEAFMTAVRYEWMFWEMSWRLETWPLELASGPG